MLDVRGHRWTNYLADREGFEPPVRLPVRRISSAVLSTTQPPVRKSNQILKTWSVRKLDQIATGLPPTYRNFVLGPLLFR